MKKNPALQDSPPAAGRFATDFIPAAVPRFAGADPAIIAFYLIGGSEGIFYQIRKNLQNYG